MCLLSVSVVLVRPIKKISKVRGSLLSRGGDICAKNKEKQGMSHFTQVFIEHLLWIRCCSRGWRYRSERIEQSRCPLRAFWYEGGSKYISEILGIRGRVYWGERVYNLKYIGHGRHHWVGNIQWGRLGMGHVSREQRPQAGVGLVQTGAVRRTEAWVPRVLEGEGGRAGLDCRASQVDVGLFCL